MRRMRGDDRIERVCGTRRSLRSLLSFDSGRQAPQRFEQRGDMKTKISCTVQDSEEMCPTLEVVPSLSKRLPNMIKCSYPLSFGRMGSSRAETDLKFPEVSNC